VRGAAGTLLQEYDISGATHPQTAKLTGTSPKLTPNFRQIATAATLPRGFSDTLQIVESDAEIRIIAACAAA
jgi:hypothetical protein